jgi:DNA polymerase III delta prime subunit
MSSSSNGIKHKEGSRLERLLSSLLSPESGVHALLLYGSETAPVEQIAARLAQGWLCANLQDGGACGECRSCKAYLHENHVDVRKVVPKPPSRIIKLQAITPRPPLDDDDYPLQDFFRTQPLVSRRKVAIIEDADRMNNDASNALLKMLEEPHPYARFVLTTHSLSGIIPTILSRCISVACKTSENDVQGFSPEVQELAKRVGKASPAEALRLSEDVRALASELDSLNGGGVRGAQSAILNQLASALMRMYPQRPEWVQLTAEAHRRITGNGSPALVLDGLFSSMLT